MKDVIRVLKSQLPIPVAIEDDDGNFVVLKLAPAGKKKLGALLQDAGHHLKEHVRRIMRRK